MKLIDEGGNEVCPVPPPTSIAEAGPQDVVVLGSEGAPGRRRSPPTCRRSATTTTRDRDDAERHPVVVLPQAGGRLRRHAGAAVDPDGMIARTSISSASSARSSIRPATGQPPGVVQVVEGNRFTLGELDGSRHAAHRAPSPTALEAPASRRRSPRHPQRDLAQAVGQPELQPDQRADARDARRPAALSRSRAS